MRKSGLPAIQPPVTEPGSLEELDLEEHLANPEIRQRFVTRLFDEIAPKYDRFTRVFSLGMDAGWKRELLADIAELVPRGGTMLDLACGTGDLAVGAARAASGVRVTGLDASPRMIAEARERLVRGHVNARPRNASVSDDVAERVEFLVGDMMRLPVPDGTIDAVTVGYGLRNVPEPARAIAEIARALRPGGRVFVLDFYLPGSRLWRALFLWYLRAAGNLVGWLWHREPVVYGYIAPSIARYVTADELARMLARAGLVVERDRRKLFGGIALHTARRPAE